MTWTQKKWSNMSNLFDNKEVWSHTLGSIATYLTTQIVWANNFIENEEKSFLILPPNEWSSKLRGGNNQLN